MNNLPKLALLVLTVSAFVGAFLASNSTDKAIESPLTVKLLETEFQTVFGTGSESRFTGVEQDELEFLVHITLSQSLADTIRGDPIPRQRILRRFCPSDPDIWLSLPEKHHITLVVKYDRGPGEHVRCRPM